MNIADGFFHSSSNQITAFADVQLALYKHDPTLQDYFMMLQLDRLGAVNPKVGSRNASERMVERVGQVGDKINRFRARRKLKADILFCPMPDFTRKTETNFLIRTLMGLARMDATILCLLPENASCRKEIDGQLGAEKRNGQVTFVDPTVALDRVDARLRWLGAKVRASKALEQTADVLGPLGFNPGEGVKSHYQYIANYVEAWERTALHVEFDAAVVRCHWHALCSPVARSARDRRKPAIAFQQGVISHTLDVPVTTSTYVAFGDSSAHFLKKMNSRFYEALGAEEPRVQYVGGGSLYDEIQQLPPSQFDNQSLLIVDVPQPSGQDDFYGVQPQCIALLDLADKLLNSDAPMRRLIVRPHPFWSNLDLQKCHDLIRRFPNRCELSHPSWPLDYDLGRASVVAGIFSGVLTVASACGLPSLFVRTESGYRSGDLECFSRGQMLSTQEAYVEIRKILTDKRAYCDAREVAIRNAREYYANGTNLDLSPEFFQRYLRPSRTSATSVAQEAGSRELD